VKSTPGIRRELVLVGGGHSHIQVLRSMAMSPVPGARTTVVVDRSVAIYSGMVPGYVARQYDRSEIELDVRPLARRAGARVVVAACTHIDPERRLVHLAGRAPIPYDVAAINVGSAVARTDLPGVAEHTVPTRPIGRFVDRIDEALGRVGDARPVRVVVVGGGAGGVELAFCARERLLADGAVAVEVTVLDAGRILPGRSDEERSRVLAAAEARGIVVREGVAVVSVSADAVAPADGADIPSDLTLWVTGAAPSAVVAASNLPKSDEGFVLVRSTLEVVGFPGLFAAGDCAVPTSRPDIPKAGVYAVRQGPVLTENLRRSLDGRALRRYRVQRDFLSLLNLGDGTAIGSKWGSVRGGEWMMRLKDRIDRRFMDRFQVLDPSGAPAPAFAKGMPAMEPMDEACGGCAAKVGASALSAALGRLPDAPETELDVVLGVDDADDVAAIRRGGELVAQTIDAFPAFVDDPWLVGRVGAANALSDMQAKGIAPRTALALVTVPEDDVEEEVLFQVLAGARSLLDEEGVTLLGGHSTVGPQLVVGFSVTGYGVDVARKGGLRDGDLLVLTRPLGTGVLFHADMAGGAAGPWMEEAVRWMARGNGAAGRVLADRGVRAATDVTGFAFAGHLHEMLMGSTCAAHVDLDAIPALPGALDLLRRGERSTFHEANRRMQRAVAATPAQQADPRYELLFDPQTAGPLLIGTPDADFIALVEALSAAGEAPVVVGRAFADPGGAGVIHLR